MRIGISGPRKWKSLEKRLPITTGIARKWMSVQLDVAQVKHNQLEAITSLQLGLDTLFAILCRAKGIPYIVVLSCKDQDKFWDESKKGIFKSLLDSAKEVKYATDKTYEEGCVSKQSKIITNWLEEDSILLSVEKGNLNQTQKERRERIKEGKIFKFKIREKDERKNQQKELTYRF